ncbi:hypothetical protein Tco_1048337 [Tanacetum coccineum]
MPTDPCHTPIITQPSSSEPQRKQKLRRPKEKDTEIPQSSVPSDPINVADEAVNEEPSMQLKVGRSRRVVSSEEESLGDQEDASKQERIDDIDADKDIYLVNVHRDKDMFGVNDLEGDEIVVEIKFVDKDVNLSVDEVTLAQELAALKNAKVQEKGDVIKEPSVPVSAALTKHAPTPIVSSQQPTQVKDKGKGKMVEEEPVKKMSKKELLKLDKELTFKLQAEEEEEQARLAREKAEKVEEANISWDNVQAMIEADRLLAERLQARARRIV